MRPRQWLVATPMRTVRIGVGAVFGGLMVLYGATFADAGEEQRAEVLTPAGLFFGLLVGLAGALLLRLPDGSRRQQLAQTTRDAGLLMASTGVAGAAGALVGSSAALLARQLSATVGSSAPGASWTLELVIICLVSGMAAAVTSALSFTVSRGLVVAGLAWNRLRRSQLRWALAHALLVATWIVTSLIAIVASARAVFHEIQQISPETYQTLTGFPRALAIVPSVTVPTIIALMLLALMTATVVGLLVATIAFPVIKRATRRIEALNVAMDRIQAGRLETRVTVSGADEVARLQSDFNAMAADLEQSVAKLRAEHAAVQALLDSRRALFAAISHDLRTPLATIRGYLDSALAEPALAAQAPGVHQDLAIISQEADRLDHLINDLFALARVDLDQLPLAVTPTALAPLLSRVVEVNQPLAWSRNRVDLLLELPPDLPPALVDPERVEQIVRNLVANAVRHTPPGGLVLLSASGDGDTLALEVRDTGEGIAATDLPHIWDRFYRGTNAADRAGAGLGLSLVKELATAMGGTVAATSAPGDGSSFIIRFPLAPVRAAHPLPVPLPMTPA